MATATRHQKHQHSRLRHARACSHAPLWVLTTHEDLYMYSECSASSSSVVEQRRVVARIHAPAGPSILSRDKNMLIS